MTPRIVLIGAGSSVFGYTSILDASNIEALQGVDLILHDTDVARLDKMGLLAERIVETTGCGIEVKWTPDREDALADADFMVLSIAVDRINRWRLDWEIPFNLGIKQVIGENGGPGGLFHTMRNIPPVLAICSDMEELCPTPSSSTTLILFPASASPSTDILTSRLWGSATRWRHSSGVSRR